jgi:hypothetical protein
LLLGKETFDEATEGVVGSRPREGDLVWLPIFKALFEIKFVNQDKFFYAFGSTNFYGYELVCEEFRYNNEKIDSGVSEIYDKVNEITVAYQAIMGSGTSTFEVDERVYQGTDLETSTASATVVSWNIGEKTLVLKDIVGIFTPNNVVRGVITNAAYTLNSIDTLENVNQTIDNNTLIKNEANNDLDVSESNPFGNPIL